MSIQISKGGIEIIGLKLLVKSAQTDGLNILTETAESIVIKVAPAIELLVQDLKLT